MTNGDQSFDKRLLWFLTVVAILFGAFAGIEVRIDSSIRDEMVERKEADRHLEERLDTGLGEIRTELRELNNYLRENGS